ncbi:MAG: hypothetical protein BWY24_00647 [Microgenomates group bacterium ADurb.Bin219]|nr:MAG: hypothetical protein BWY24_00647 [Microgenomates group bacterium ADurb.Bin219]HNP89163.1 hypothetical protein [Candidatus Woesebacteria bacterium]
MNSPENLTNKKLIGLLRGLAESVPLPDPKRMEQGKQKLLAETGKRKVELSRVVNSVGQKKEEEGQKIGEDLPPQQ